MRYVTGKQSDYDAFCRVRTSRPFTLFDSQLEYDKAPLVWNELLVSGGTSTHLITQGSVELKTNTTNGSSVIRQTKQYMRYKPGKSHLILFTAVFGPAKANCTKRCGYYDGYDGVFFEQTGDGIFVVKRSYVTGSAVDTRIPQANWNIDPLNYSGRSNLNIDFSKIQLFVIDLEYLGAGTVRFGFYINGEVFYCHKMHHGNILSSTYMSSCNLPIRFEITNTNTTASETTLIAANASVESEGGEEDEKGYRFSASNRTLKATSTDLVPLISLRLKNPINSKPNKTTVILEYIDLLAKTEDVQFCLYYNATLTNASFADVNSNSFCQVDLSATAVNISNSLLIFSGYCIAGGKHTSGSVAHSISNRLALGLNPDNTTADVYTLCAATFQNTGTACATFNWREFR